MVRTYRAVLHGDRVEWLQAPPDTATPLKVQITLLDESTQEAPPPQGEAMSQALETLARLGAFSEIADPDA